MFNILKNQGYSMFKILKIQGRLFSTKKLDPQSNKQNSVSSDQSCQSNNKSAQQLSYFKNRLQTLDTNNHNYPDFSPTISLVKFNAKYQGLNKGEESVEEEKVSGRVTAIRTHGKTTFIDIRQEHLKLQVATSNLKLPIRRGDIIGVSGKGFVTKKGQLSILASQLNILAPCLWMLPQYESLKDPETRYRSKHLDLITNKESLMTIKKRSQIIKSLRNQLNNLGYIEVQTPILSSSCGGAIAKPFITYHNDQKMNLFLRIAPELDLKKMIIGGLGRVYEIGKNFRNQSIDQTHNPQFTSCQLYCSYSNYREMMQFTKILINNIAQEVNGSSLLKFPKTNTQIDLSQKWIEKDFMQELQKCLNRKLPIDFQSEQTHKFYSDLCKQFNLQCEEPRTISRLLDKLGAHFLQNTNDPLLIINHPRVMSPLAKPLPQKPHLTQRFQLFINGYELVNSYTQLNDPRVQKQNTPDEKQFIQALEYGLVPCAGWGIGVDRLVMLLTGKDNIQEVIPYPLMKAKDKTNLG